MSIQTFQLEIHPQIPERLSRLTELADNLWYCWDQSARRLFRSLDNELWMQLGHSPKLFLHSIEQQRLQAAAQNQVFLDRYNQVLLVYDMYHGKTERRGAGKKLAQDDLIAYFCAEYGFHESLRVYSGGLGILAGDHCKAASDLRLPFTGVGLLYHKGYFSQMIDAEGRQTALPSHVEPRHAPVSKVIDEQGNALSVKVDIADREVTVIAWKVRVGHISLYLLDTEVPENAEEDRSITRQLYGGGEDLRIRQEIVLGIGGVRMLRKLGLAPTIWHINEGHAAFQILERVRELVADGNLDCRDALEAVAANTVFTTHTQVPAGHDHFPEGLFMHQLGSFAGKLGLSNHEFMALGRLPDDSPDFNMTTLAITGARHINGVSRIHGRVSSEICAKNWPGILPRENPISYVTNGVHVPTFLLQDWHSLFDQYLGAEWRNRLTDIDFWRHIDAIPAHMFWSVKQAIKSQMLEVLRATLLVQHARNQVSEVHLERMLKHLDPHNPNVLTIGFARRFATYKRATLLFSDLELLRKILNNKKRPVLFVFAGKAHPADQPGQELMKTVHEMSCRPEFVGKILLVEGYNISLGRRLVSGVDVWLNTPVYPQEASGTSGMKAAINGTINLSVLDGWWAEGYDGKNGWAIRPSTQKNTELRDREDARTLYELLQDKVIPLYYERESFGYSEAWVKKAKYSMSTILPRFNMLRMMNEYLDKLYIPAARHGRQMMADHGGNARILAAWKAKVKAAWPKVRIRVLTKPEPVHQCGDQITVETAVHLAGLPAEDITVELLLTQHVEGKGNFVASDCFFGKSKQASSKTSQDEQPPTAYTFSPEHALPENNEHLYRLTFQPKHYGALCYRIRIFPSHKLLADKHEAGLMTWA
ncbi:MAG: glycosyltransferase family 1 protein [Gammaproteobacteria bacterium]|nr:glycosyltransferase family 1 protein [Gammaproteobacteria bacterium]